MCGPSTHALSRRSFLEGSFLAAAGGLVPRLGPDHSVRRVAPHAGPLADVEPVSMAMHMHASFDEGYASMEQHLTQATSYGIDVLWWTFHDYRMSAVNGRRAVHFNGLDEVENGQVWSWVGERHGRLSDDSGVWAVSSPTSPKDPVGGGSLHALARATGSGPATAMLYADSKPSDQNYRFNVTGQQISVEVLPTHVGPDAFLELRVTCSLHPAQAGRPAGMYVLSYRFAAGRPAGREAQGLLGVVTVPVVAGRWNSVSLRPQQDLARLWPTMDARDNNTYELRLGATASGRGTTAEGYFDFLRFRRPTSGGTAPMAVRSSLMSRLARRFPAVRQVAALEVSYALPHVNWYGGDVAIPDYSGLHTPPEDVQPDLVRTLVEGIHAAGGLASYNHPFGSTLEDAYPAAVQDALLADVAKDMLGWRVLGTDLIEVGYPLRAGVAMSRHLALWDILTRHGYYLTGTGVSDDHVAVDYLTRPRGGVTDVNNFFTHAWSGSASEPDLLAAMRAGRVFMARLGRFSGRLDSLVDDEVPMGAASASSRPSRRLSVLATGLSPDATVRVLQGPVDIPGLADLTPGTRTIAKAPASAFRSRGGVELTLDTSVRSFVRFEVTDSTGTIALGNPTWLLQPGDPVPATRAA